MTNAAVAEAPAKPAESQDANPAPGSQAPASPDATQVNAGTDQEQPNQATSQTAPAPEATPESDVKPEPPKPAAVTPEALAEAARVLKAQQDEATRQADIKRTQDELRQMRREGGKLARNVLAKVEDHFDGRLPAELRDEVENFVETLNAKAYEAAKLELGDEADQRETEINRDFVQSVLGAVGQQLGGPLHTESRGKDRATWIKNALKYAPQPEGTVTVPALIDEATAWGEDAATALNDTEKAELTKALKGAKTAKAIIREVAKYAAVKENRAPGAAPSGNERGAERQYTYQEVSRMNKDQLDALPEGVFDKVMAGNRR